MYTGNASSIFIPIAMHFLPTLLVSLITYPHYSKLNHEQQKRWIKEWGYKKIPLSLLFITLLSSVFPLLSFIEIPSLYYLPYSFALAIIPFVIMFMIYYGWIKMITPVDEY